ncbi:hypothetical protein Tco_1481052 [Tanacetum coccineum]
MSIQEMEDLKQQYLDEMKTLINEKDYRNEKIDIEIKINELKENFNGMSIEINKKKKLQQLEQVANLSTYPSQHFNSFCYDDDDDDDDEEFSIPMSKIYKSSLTAITPNSPITDSLIMEDEHLDTILETKSDEEYESSVEDLNLTPSEFEDLSDIEKSDLIESLLNRDTLIISSPNFDSLLEEIPGELAHIDLIPSGNNEADFDPEEDIHLVERLLYDNLSPRPPEEFNSKNSDTIIKSFSPSPIPVEDNDSLMEEIDLFLTPDDSMPPGIENDDYDSEADILEEFLSNDSPSLTVNESFHFDVPSSLSPPTKPSDDRIYFEPDTGVSIVKVVGDISKHYVLMPRLLPTQPTLCPVIDTLLLFSSENEDKVHLLSHRGFKAF